MDFPQTIKNYLVNVKVAYVPRRPWSIALTLAYHVPAVNRVLTSIFASLHSVKSIVGAEKFAFAETCTSYAVIPAVPTAVGATHVKKGVA